MVVGLVVYLLLSRSGPLGGLGWLFTPSAMVVAQIIIAWPVVAGLTMTAVQGVDPGLRLQVRALGATRWQELAAVLAKRGSACWPPWWRRSDRLSQRSAP